MDRMIMFVVKNSGYDVNYVNGLQIFEFFDLYDTVKEEYVKKHKEKSGRN